MASKEVAHKLSAHPDSDDEHDHTEDKDTAGWDSSDNEADESFLKSIPGTADESLSADKISLNDSYTVDIANDEEFKRSLANLYLNTYVAMNPDDAKHCSDSILACAECCQKADFYEDHENVKFVPCAIEIDVSKAFGVGRRTLYAFLSSTNLCDKNYVLRSYKEWDKVLPVVRPPSNGTSDTRVSDVEDRRLRLNHSYGSLFYNTTNSDVQNKLDKFLTFTDYTTKLLTKSINGGVDAKRHRASVAPFTKENHCLVRVGNAMYSQQYMGTNNDELVFIVCNSRAYEKLRIPLSALLDVHSVDNNRNEFFLPDMYTLFVSTFSKKYEVLLRTKEIRDSWLHLLYAQVTVNKHAGGGGIYESPQKSVKSVMSSISHTSRNSSIRRISITSNEGDIHPFVDTVSKTKGWKSMSDRPALNCRSFTRYRYKHHFPGLNLRVGDTREERKICNGSGRCSSCVGEDSGIGFLGRQVDQRVYENPANIVVQDLLDCLHLPCLFVCKLLDLALKLTKLMNTGIEDCGRNSICDDAVVTSHHLSLSPEVHQLWIDFMDGAALLQTIDLTNVNMNREDTYCMFLNLYHVMMLHGYFAIGRPVTFMQWSSFFHKVTYEAFGDVFSMVELEHCIIRKVMPPINIGPIAQTLVIPSAHYGFVNQYKDYRLIWALNCGTYGFIPYIPIFSPEKLVKQLSQVARKSLQLQMRINVPTNSVTLPLPCQWFIGYFALRPAMETVFSFEMDDTVSGNQILTTLYPDLGLDMKESLSTLLKKKVPITIKYSPFEFKCQLLYKMTDDEGIEK